MSFEDNIKKLVNSIDSKEKLRIIYFESGDSNIKATVKLLKKARYLKVIF